MNHVELANKALSEAKAINTAAKENNWEDVSVMQAQHANTVNQIAIAEIPVDDTEEIKTILIETRAIDRETENLATQKKDSLVTEKKTLSKASNMQKVLDSL